MKTALIVSLAIIILVLGGVWAYLLLYGAPKDLSDVSGNIFGESRGVAPQTSTDTPLTPNTNTARTVKTDALLQKLTARTVAGAMISTSSVNTFIRYAEKGTGHIYEIDLATGAEIRLSNTTVPRVADAYFSPRGDRVVMITDSNGQRESTLLGSLKASSTETTLLTEPLGVIHNIAFTYDGNTLFYTERNTQGGSSAFSRTLSTGATSLLFSLPFAESAMLWDLWDKKNHYTYTRPALGFMGYIYAVVGENLRKVDEGTTLSGVRIGTSTIIVNKSTGKGPHSLLIDDTRSMSNFLTIQTLPEKCAGTVSTFWCATDTSQNTALFPTYWYQGAVSMSDSIFEINGRTGESSVVVNPESFAREQIDVTDIAYGGSETLIFKNKRDDSLWIFNPPQTAQ